MLFCLKVSAMASNSTFVKEDANSTFVKEDVDSTFVKEDVDSSLDIFRDTTNTTSSSLESSGATAANASQHQLQHQPRKFRKSEDQTREPLLSDINSSSDLSVEGVSKPMMRKRKLNTKKSGFFNPV